MALPSTGVIEIRSTATAGNVNGGGFNSALGGTDYTLQDTAQLALTDLASTSASGWLTLTSATGGFTSAMVGNYIHIASGTNFTAGWYEVTAYTDTNTVTVDRACGATADASAGVGKLGGAMSLNSTLDDDLFEIGVAGNIFYIKAGTYSLGESVSITATGSVQKPINVIGYNATRGDVPTGTNRPLLNCAANGFSLGANWDIYNVNLTSTTSNGLSTGTGGKFINCKSVNRSTTADRGGITSNADSLILFCEGVSYFGYALNSTSGVAQGCYFHDSKYGVDLPGSTLVSFLLNNIIASCYNSAIIDSVAQTGRVHIVGNTIYGAENKTGIGVNLITTTTDISLVNNIIYGFVTGVTHADTQSVGYDDYNDYFNNTTDVTNWTKGTNDVAVNPVFTNVGQVTGTTGAFVAGGSKLIDTSKDFTSLGVVAGDYVYIISGTGVTAGIVGIISISTTTNPNDTLNTDVNPGTNTTADKVYQITIGNNFAIGTNLKALGYPGAFQGGFTTGYMDIGAVQRQEQASSSGGIAGVQIL